MSGYLIRPHYSAKDDYSVVTKEVKQTILFTK